MVLGAALNGAQGDQLLSAWVHQFAVQIVQDYVHGGPGILLAVVAVLQLDLAVYDSRRQTFQRKLEWLVRARGRVREQQRRVHDQRVDHAEHQQVGAQSVADEYRVATDVPQKVAPDLVQRLGRMACEVLRGDAAVPGVVVHNRAAGLDQRVVDDRTADVHQRHLGHLQATLGVAHFAVQGKHAAHVCARYRRFQQHFFRPQHTRFFRTRRVREQHGPGARVTRLHEIADLVIAVRKSVPHVLIGLGATRRRLALCQATIVRALFHGIDELVLAVVVLAPAVRRRFVLVLHVVKRRAPNARDVIV